MDLDECDIVECRTDKQNQRVMVEVEYTVNGEKRKRGWGFSFDAFESGRFLNIIKNVIDFERNKPDIPKSVNDKTLKIKGQKIDLKNQKILSKDTGVEIK